MSPNAQQPAPEAEAFISGQVARVNVAAIEKELKALWQKSDGGKGGGTTIVRSASFNLVLFSTDDDAEQKCSDLLDTVLQHHPCRGILAIYRPEKEHHLSAWVSARCHLEGSSRTVCAEQITVCDDGGPIQELASVVLPLILPDLPVFLWWRHPHIERLNFEPLHECSRRFIADSNLNPFDHRFLLEVAGLIEQNRHCLWVSDLNWRRMTGWCRSIADAFDGFPVPTSQLWNIKSLNVTYAANEKPPVVSAQALMLVGWLAARLDWRPVAFVGRDTNASATFQTENSPVEIKFLAQPSDTTHQGGLLQADFEFGDGKHLNVKLEQDQEMSFVVARADNSQDKELTRTSHDLDEATLVGQEVEVLGSDPIYEAAMDMVAKLIEFWEI